MDSLSPVQTAWQQVIEMVQGTVKLLPNIATAIIVFIIFWFIAKFSRRIIKNLTRKKKSRNLGLVLARLSQGFIILIGAFIALAIVVPSFKPGDLVQLLGVSGVAVGFAFRDILQNFLAGILILITEPFVIGDQIVFKDFEGTVENIQTRATTIRPEALVVELAASTINIRARWWVQPPRRAEILDSQDEVLTKLCNRLVAGGIDLPFPTQQILFHDQTEETDGDRAKQREGWPAVKGNNPKPRRIASSLRQLAQSGGNVNGNGKDSRNGQENYS